MNTYEVYVMFLALKRHFTTDYNFHKFHGKVKASREALERRNDRFFFDKLAKHSDPKGFMLAAFSREEPRSMFIGTMLRDSSYQQTYIDWLKYQESIEYFFKEEISSLQYSDFKVSSGRHPNVLNNYFEKKISLETLCILCKELNLLSSWTRDIRDTLIFPDVKMKIEKYTGFIKYDRTKIRVAMKEVFAATV